MPFLIGSQRTLALVHHTPLVTAQAPAACPPFPALQHPSSLLVSPTSALFWAGSVLDFEAILWCGLETRFSSKTQCLKVAAQEKVPELKSTLKGQRKKMGVACLFPCLAFPLCWEEWEPLTCSTGQKSLKIIFQDISVLKNPCIYFEGKILT